jgi:hypothetical protein
MLKAGDFFIGKYPPGSNKDRRIIVITDEDGKGLVAIVYLSTQLSDLTVVFDPGDHPKITESCCAVFDEAAIADAEKISAGVDSQLIIKHPISLASTLVARIQEGVFDSASDKIAEFCKERC